MAGYSRIRVVAGVSVAAGLLSLGGSASAQIPNSDAFGLSQDEYGAAAVFPTGGCSDFVAVGRGAMGVADTQSPQTAEYSRPYSYYYIARASRDARNDCIYSEDSGPVSPTQFVVDPLLSHATLSVDGITVTFTGTGLAPTPYSGQIIAPQADDWSMANVGAGLSRCARATSPQLGVADWGTLWVDSSTTAMGSPVQ
jgi:hypothetical protein